MPLYRARLPGVWMSQGMSSSSRSPKVKGARASQVVSGKITGFKGGGPHNDPASMAARLWASIRRVGSEATMGQP